MYVERRSDIHMTNESSYSTSWSSNVSSDLLGWHLRQSPMVTFVFSSEPLTSRVLPTSFIATPCLTHPQCIFPLPPGLLGPSLNRTQKAANGMIRRILH